MKKLNILSLVAVGLFIVGCGGGEIDTSNAHNNSLNANKKLDSLQTSNLKGHRITIEYFDPFNYELDFLCDGGYKLSKESNKYDIDPVIDEEFHYSGMYHTKPDKIIFDGGYLTNDNTYYSKYRLFLDNGKIVVNKSYFTSGTFTYKVKEIKQTAICK